LSESRGRGANIAELIQEELAPYRTPRFDRVRVSGKSLSLEPSTAQALALALHELATNAAKYGALSLPSGGVQVDWELKGARLELRWRESGGPPVDETAPGGFGIRVIKASVETQLGGTVEFDWRHEGLQCAIAIPHQVKLEFPGNSHASAQKPSAHGSGLVEVGLRKRVMLVEDESLIAMMMEQTLSDLGYDVVGPFGTVREAIEAIECEPVDAAILDINLGGEMAYPIARILQGRKVPFVFMTGYGAETIGAPFPGVRTFQKPLERETLRQLFAPNAPDPTLIKPAVLAQRFGYAASHG